MRHRDGRMRVGRMRVGRRMRAAAVAAVALLALGACASTVSGTGTVDNAADTKLQVTGVDSSSSFDQTVQNALSDIEAFWRKNYPSVSGGKSLTPLKGGLYSVDGAQVVQDGDVQGPASAEACVKRSADFIVDNAAFCILDDSIIWDRAPSHLFVKLAQHYGPLMVALIFAHEFGHSISYRLGVFDNPPQTIYTESQADCAAGAWAASALKHQAPHFVTTTPAKLDAALEGFLNGRDSTPGTIDQISHGNGFDRLSALADGIKNGPTYCFAKNYFNRTFTERPFTDQQDYDSGGNEPLADVTDTSSNNGLVTDLNRFWTAKGKTIGKTFKPVAIAEAAHPKCGADAQSEFGYCPDDNTVYFSSAFARSTYYSLPDVSFDQDTGAATLQFHQPADYALGELFAVGWGLAVRHQFFSGDMTGSSALSAAVCYSGSYAKDVNVAAGTPGHNFVLSPADLDEAVSALLDQAGTNQAFGARGTTGLSRIQSFNQGYKQSLSSCR